LRIGTAKWSCSTGYGVEGSGFVPLIARSDVRASGIGDHQALIAGADAPTERDPVSSPGLKLGQDRSAGSLAMGPSLLPSIRVTLMSAPPGPA
jgi:hypothetical protein